MSNTFHCIYFLMYQSVCFKIQNPKKQTVPLHKCKWCGSWVLSFCEFEFCDAFIFQHVSGVWGHRMTLCQVKMVQKTNCALSEHDIIIQQKQIGLYISSDLMSFWLQFGNETVEFLSKNVWPFIFELQLKGIKHNSILHNRVPPPNFHLDSSKWKICELQS